MFKTSTHILLFILVFCHFISADPVYSQVTGFEKYKTAEQFEAYLDSLLNGQHKFPDSIQAYQNQLLSQKQLLKEKGNLYTKLYYFIEMAETNSLLDETAQAYQNMEEALHLVPFSKHASLHFKILQAAEKTARKHRDYKTSIDYLKRMYESGFLPETSKQLADILLSIARYNWNMHNYHESIKYCDKVMPLLQEQNYEEGKIEALLIMYQNAHYSTQDSSWNVYLRQALAIAEELKDSAQISKVYYTIGYSFYRENEHLKAIEYYKKSRSYASIKGSASELTTVIMQQLSYTLIDSVESVNQTSSYIINQGIKNNIPSVLSNAYRGRAWYFAKTGKKDSAVFYLNKAFESRQALSEKKDASPGFYRYLYDVAMLIPDYELALKFLNISSAQTRQISKENNAKELSTARADFDYQIQRERIHKLSLENELQKEKNHRQRLLIIAIVLLLIIGVLFLLFAQNKYAELRSSYRELVKKNKELDKIKLQLKSAENQLQIKSNGNSNGKHIKDENLLYLRIKELFEEEKIYREQNLSIRELAERLETNTTYLSTVINHRFEVSFKTLLNKYRVNEARNILETKKYANLTIEGIAEKVGYNSRSTFYNAFKEITGLTPTQYMNGLDKD